MDRGTRVEYSRSALLAVGRRLQLYFLAIHYYYIYYLALFLGKVSVHRSKENSARNGHKCVYMWEVFFVLLTFETNPLRSLDSSGQRGRSGTSEPCCGRVYAIVYFLTAHCYNGKCLYLAVSPEKDSLAPE